MTVLKLILKRITKLNVYIWKMSCYFFLFVCLFVFPFFKDFLLRFFFIVAIVCASTDLKTNLKRFTLKRSDSCMGKIIL